MPKKAQAQTRAKGDKTRPFDIDAARSASPSAAAHLRQYSESILSTWTRIVREQAGLAQASADTSFLRDSLPLVLQNLAD